jgi:hypothetical protein
MSDDDVKTRSQRARQGRLRRPSSVADDQLADPGFRAGLRADAGPSAKSGPAPGPCHAPAPPVHSFFVGAGLRPRRNENRTTRMGANLKIETLLDLAKHGLNVDVLCWCGHRSIVDGAQLRRWYMCHRHDLRWIAAGEHLFCSRCWARPQWFGLSKRPPTAPDRFPRNEAEWSQLVRRLRG